MMKVDILDLLNDLRAQGVLAVVENGKLQINKPNQLTLESTLIDQIQENKSAIIDFLESSEATTQETDMAVIDRNMLHIPLSYAQERIWELDQLEVGSLSHIPIICKISGTLNVSALKKAFESVIHRHEVLRTIYPDHDGTPYQEILPENNGSFDVLDFSRASFGEIKDFLIRETNRPFKLNREAAIRAILLKADEDAYYFSMAIHNIAADAASIAVLQNELIQCYHASHTAKSSELVPLDLQYVDYACWQRKQWDRKAFGSQLDYWSHKLLGYEPLNFNTDFCQETSGGLSKSVIDHHISKELSDKVTQRCADQEVTLYMYLLAAYQVLLSQFTGQKDVVVGSPVKNRPYQHIKSLIGFFANTIPMRSVIDPSSSFSDLLSEIRETVSCAYRNQEVPFEKIIERIEGIQEITQSKLTHAMFVLHDTPEIKVMEVSGIKMEWETKAIEDFRSELTLTVIPDPEGLVIQVNYHDECFKKETMIHLVRHFENILNAVVENPNLVIVDIPEMKMEELEEVMIM